MPADRQLDVWAGVECSVVRVGDRIVDELALTGHARRPGDLRRLAELGVGTVRYPALWERHPDAGRGRLDWRGTDARMRVMESLGMRPILGLLHQGTGRHGEVLEEEFATAFGAYAGEVARRYPSVRAFLPINEPLTTARFAGLYGRWYPHARDPGSFARILVSLALAHRAAARAIRRVRPDATVLVTEDVGDTLSTPKVARQAAFDRARRWLVLDAITGRLGPLHPLRGWLIAAGASAKDLDNLAEDPEPPDLLGIHHYPTSDRFLDHRLDRYPGWTHGGNGRQAYADVELLRVLEEPRDGLREALRAAWDRYRLPIALTEVHLGGAAADRRAWWWGAVGTAEDLLARGVDVRAVTAWSAFGSWEWPSLLTRVEGHYEPGLYDTRHAPPRPTALAADVAAAVAGRRRRPPRPGWWRRRDRVLYPPVLPSGVDAIRDAAGARDSDPRRRGWPLPEPGIPTSAGPEASGPAHDRVAVGDPAALAAALRRSLGLRDPDAAAIRVVHAPGRVNLIGEHTDYNDGLVLPAAIDRGISIALLPIPDRRVCLTLAASGERAELDLDDLPPRSGSWVDYVAGTAWAIRAAGGRVSGFEGLLAADLPIGAGLSSSAALELVVAWALGGGAPPLDDRLALARAAQRAENEYVGVPSGLMDQFAVTFGIEDAAVLLDCRSLEHGVVALPADLRLVIADSEVPRQLARSAYAGRRTECRRAVEGIRRLAPEVDSLRDVTLDLLERSRRILDDVAFRRARHVVTENARVLAVVDALSANDRTAVRAAFAASHASLRDDFEVSTPELDRLVEIATASPGVVGARLTGAGFGGATVNLVVEDEVDTLVDRLRREYRTPSGSEPDVLVVRASSGVRTVWPEPPST